MAVVHRIILSILAKQQVALVSIKVDLDSFIFPPFSAVRKSSLLWSPFNARYSGFCVSLLPNVHDALVFTSCSNCIPFSSSPISFRSFWFKRGQFSQVSMRRSRMPTRWTSSTLYTEYPKFSDVSASTKACQSSKIGETCKNSHICFALISEIPMPGKPQVSTQQRALHQSVQAQNLRLA